MRITKSIFALFGIGIATARGAMVYYSESEWLAAIDSPDTLVSTGGFSMTPTGEPVGVPGGNYYGTNTYANYFPLIVAQNGLGTGANIGLWNVGLTMGANPRLFRAFSITIEIISGPWTIEIGGNQYVASAGFMGWIADPQPLGGAESPYDGRQQPINITTTIEYTPSASITLSSMQYTFIPEPTTAAMSILGLLALFRRRR